MESWTKKAEENEESAMTSAPSTAPSAASPAEFYRSKPVLDRRVHIMGVGSVGSFVAHAIRGVPNPPPVTLLFPSWSRLNAWKESPQRLSLITEGDTETRDGYEAELAIPRLRYHGREVAMSSSGGDTVLEGESTAPISSLILCCKAYQVLQGLSAVKHRLHKDSVILFMQNGMGIVDQVNRDIFPDPATRPHYMLGINSHGMHASPDGPFTTVHAGFGTISLGLLPHERLRDPSAPYAPRTNDALLPHTTSSNRPRSGASTPAQQHSPPPPGTQEDDVALPQSTSVPWTPTERYLLRTLLRVPVLAATAFSPPDLLQMQLEKLAVNCVINPLTVLLDARNGSILYNYSITRSMRLLLAEISLVFRSLPELQYIPNVDKRFDPGRLETLVVSVAKKTESNVSSMLADVRRGGRTEIDWLNGWVGKQGMIEKEVDEGVPVVEGREGKAYPLSHNLDEAMEKSSNHRVLPVRIPYTLTPSNLFTHKSPNLPHMQEVSAALNRPDI
ncbi:hypothetical protein E8E13_001299 [Curvularia kusanoi]|uniref:2-dehydropantoate 2-reductase n=1 Tax=Curvularia kusanoi TaxID=90978 RepID=A0A9P4TD54_CURKU|nr:hypothetical protein E8E13_001299 [Curvularia kusanoi]